MTLEDRGERAGLQETAAGDGAGESGPGSPFAPGGASPAAGTAGSLAITPGDGAGPAGAPARRRRGRLSLSAKLLGLTVVFVMACEMAVFVPSLAGFRVSWLRDALGRAAVAALILSDSREISPTLQASIVNATGALALAVVEGDRRRLLALSREPLKVGLHVDLDRPGRMLPMIDALDVLAARGQRMIRVSAPLQGTGDRVEVVLPEAPLYHAMVSYAARILAISLVISLLTAALIYWSLRRLIVRPLQHMSHAIETFAAAPEDLGHVLEPSLRSDEIGDAWRRLRRMQQELSRTLQQRRRLAELGLAVSKINHDLRNLLASAQLLSDRLASADDPMVQRLAPKITETLDRAVAYTRSVMAYGAAREAPPERRLVRVSDVVVEMREAVGLAGPSDIAFVNAVPPDLEVDADPEQLFRILVNLGRNAVQALHAARDRPGVVKRLTVSAERTGTVASITVADTGPGVPARAREHLFRAFTGGARPGGVGLGLAIAAELVRAHGGQIALAGGPPGATFTFTIPDRPVDLDAVRRASARG
ncbi:HAMP domain-containing sensor histidine kinase [Pseudoxanthobacter sp.]|uniref:sensor histidine kinase n=1 Tax=Pseudoxanthobacter sp. TaxID=1925742 RepID=UPI002FDF62C2